MAALKGDWQKPKTIEKKEPVKKATATAKPPSRRPKFDLEGLAQTWKVASEQRRSDWLVAMSAEEVQFFAPRLGQEPRTVFLLKLGEIIASSREPVQSSRL
jgi:hypothetical protein